MKDSTKDSLLTAGQVVGGAYVSQAAGRGLVRDAAGTVHAFDELLDEEPGFAEFFYKYLVPLGGVCSTICWGFWHKWYLGLAAFLIWKIRPEIPWTWVSWWCLFGLFIMLPIAIFSDSANLGDVWGFISMGFWILCPVYPFPS